MATEAKKYEQMILDAVKEHKICFFDHVFAFVAISRSTAFLYRLNESDVIRDALSQNRVKAKSYMLDKWVKSDNATLQISAYRLLSSTEEHKKLNQSYIDHTSDGEKVANQPVNIVFTTFDNNTTEDEPAPGSESD